MKKILALSLILTLIAALAIPVLAGFEEEANNKKVAYEFKGCAEKPVIDGKLDEFGYSKIDPASGDMSYAYNDSTDGATDIAKALSFDFYASYDEDYVYIFVSTDTKYYYNDMKNGSGDIWAQSVIQLNFANVGDEGETRLEYGIGRNSIDGQQEFFAWAQYADAGQDIVLEEGTDYVVKLDGSRINYEVRTPVTTFMPKDTKLKPGDKFTFCLVMAQCDKEKGEGSTEGYIHTQIASGCTGNGKTAENFATITLGAPIEKTAPVEEAPAESEETPAAVEEAPAPVPEGPQTGDMTVLFVIPAVIAGAGVCVALKKRGNVR